MMTRVELIPMWRALRFRRQPADQPAGTCMRNATNAAACLALLVAFAAPAAPVVSGAEGRYRSDCEVVETTRLENFGHDGQPARLSHFTCRITGGPLHGSAVIGTNIWDMSGGVSGILLGSIAIAQRPGANVMYEVHDVNHHLQTRDGKVVGREATSWGVYKSATGSAAHLAGKTFTSAVHYTSPRTFIIENIIDED